MIFKQHVESQTACLCFAANPPDNTNTVDRKLSDRMNPTAKFSILLLVIRLSSDIDQVFGADPAIKNVLFQQHKDEPFFLAVGLVRPHYPMVAPRQNFDLYPWEQMQMPPQQPGDLDDIPIVGRDSRSRKAVGGLVSLCTRTVVRQGKNKK